MLGVFQNEFNSRKNQKQTSTDILEGTSGEILGDTLEKSQEQHFQKYRDKFWNIAKKMGEFQRNYL